MKYLQTFESYNSSAPISKGAEIEQVYADGLPLSDKRIDKTITEEEKEELEKGEKEISKRVKTKKKYKVE